MIYYHATNRESSKSIQMTGLRKGTYVTTYPLSNLTPTERVRLLCLNEENKGVCLCEVQGTSVSLREQPEGSLTCGGLDQWITNEDIPSQQIRCTCNEGINWGKLALLLGGIALFGIFAYPVCKEVKKW